MTAVKFFKIDLAMTRGRWKTLIIYFITSFIIMFGFKSPLYAVFYLPLCAVYLSASPFYAEKSINPVFINLLPARPINRVLGRFLYSLFLILVTIVLSEVCLFSYKLIKKELPAGYLLLQIFVISITIFYVSLQNTLFFSVLDGKDTQKMNFIGTVPSFIMLVIFLILTFNLNNLRPLSQFAHNHTAVFSSTTLLAGCLFLTAGVLISTKINQKKDHT